MNNVQQLMKYMLVVVLSMASAVNAKAAAPSGDGMQNNLLLRKIGHEFLRATGDSTSRILPVKELPGGGYHLPLKNQLAFLPDSLAKVVTIFAKAGLLPGHFTFTVTESGSHKIVYGFTSDDVKRGDIPCIGRALPKGNYVLSMYIFPEGLLTGSNKSLIIRCAALLLLLLITAGIIIKKRSDMRHKSLPGTIPLGRYTFDPGKRLLTIGEEQTVLTAKELTLLNILVKKTNQVMDRNTLLKEGWEDEGVITGRSLDMYISKLRKKLLKDPLIKITNFHGRGYALEIRSGQ